MRSLPYVKFLDVARPFKPAFSELEHVRNLPSKLGLRTKLGLSDMFPEGFSEGMTHYLGGQFATDNHTHSLSVFGEEFSGNPGLRQLAVDLWLLSRNKDLNADLVFNPLTAPVGLGSAGQSGLTQLRSLELTDGVLTFGSLYDLTGPTGPYHPSLEELRGDPLIKDFRDWMDGQRNRLDNQEVATVQADVDATIREFKKKSLRSAVERVSVRDVLVKITRDALLDHLPGGSILSNLSDAILENRRVAGERWKAFIALGRDVLTPS